MMKIKKVEQNRRDLHSCFGKGHTKRKRRKFMRKQQCVVTWILTLLILLQPLPVAARQRKVDGFKEIKKEKYKADILHHYKHLASGLEVVWIENKDINKAFVLGVKTPTTDNTGVNHIIEHTLFTGSQNYPSASLFFDANEAYPCTYMNALTSGDMTIFPFATPYEASYDALLPIYLDAVFKPNFLQIPYGFYEESFYYEPIENRYGGVVYNEMKGAYGSIDRAIYRQIRQMIFKDTHYAYDSGGNPEEIPRLTYEQCKETYDNYYYPGNMKIIVYGKLNIESVLKRIASYLTNTTNPQVEVDLSVSKLNEEHTGTFEVLPSASKGCLVKAFVLDAATSSEKLQQMDLWMTAYLMSPQAYLQSQLNKQGYHIKWLKDDDVPYPVYALIIMDLPIEQMKSCEELVDHLLEECKGKEQRNVFLEQDMLKESKWLLEKQEESNNRGIYIAESLLDDWAHNRGPNGYFIKKQQINAMKEIEMGMEEILLEKAERYTLYLLPDQTPFNNPLTQMSLKNEEWQQINEKMKEWQQVKRDLKPLAIESLVTGIKDTPLITKEKDYWTMETRTETQLARSQAYLNTSNIPQNKLNYLFLYSYLLEENGRDTTPYSGTFATECTAYPLEEGYWPCFKVTLTTLPEEWQHGVLFNEIRMNLLNRPDKWFVQKLRELVLNMKANSKNNAIGTLAALSMAGADERTNYLYQQHYPFYCYCQHLLEIPNTHWINEVKQIDAQLYHKGGLIVTTTLGKKGKNRYKESWQQVIEQFERVPNLKGEYSFNVPTTDCLVPSEIEVDHSFKALYKKEGVTGEDYLLAACLTKNYLNPKLRVEQGAYGAGCQIYNLKTLGMYAYRAPDYVETLRVMEDSIKFLSTISEKTLEKSKVEALSRVHEHYKLLGTPLEKAEAVEQLILWGKSPKEVLHLQKEILCANKESISKSLNIYKNTIKSSKTAIMTGKESSKEQNFTIYRY